MTREQSTASFHGARLAAMALFALTLGGCVAIPVKPPPGEPPFQEDLLAFVEAGQTHRDEVHARMSEAGDTTRLWRFDDDALWVYSASRETWQWLVCVGGPYMADCDIAGDTRNHFLKFEFDRDGIVTAWNATSTLADCSSDGICLRQGTLMLYADPARDRHAKQLVPEDSCAAFVLMTAPGGWGAGTQDVAAWIDEKYLGVLLDSDAYLLALLGPGEHQVVTAAAVETGLESGFGQIRHGRHTQSLRVECEPGQTLFIHHNARDKRKGEKRFTLELLEDGSAALLERRLALPAMEEPEALRSRTIRVSQMSKAARELDLKSSAKSLEDLQAILGYMEDEDIFWRVQNRLRELGHYEGPLNSRLTEETEAAILAFKKQQGIYGNTVLDDNTLEALGVFGK